MGDNTLSLYDNESELFMTTREQVQLGFSAVNDIIGIFNYLNAGRSKATNYNFQASMNKINADMVMRDAGSILDYYGRQANIVREQGKKARAEQRVAMGASGFDVGSASYENILTETDRNIATNIALIRQEAMTKYAGAKYQAKQQEIQGELNRSAAKISKKSDKYAAIISGLSAMTKVGAISYFGDNYYGSNS